MVKANNASPPTEETIRPVKAAEIPAVPVAGVLSEEPLADDVVGGLPGSAIFEKHRPKYHFLAPSQWMNDPCGPFYNEESGEYHLYYQYNPFGSKWGHMTWGSATSKDMVFWKHAPEAIRPEASFDHLGIFAGSVVPKGYKGLPTAYYTGTSHLPIGWRLKYTRGAEKIAMATSSDGGFTWKKHEKELVSGPPEHLDVTSWRDPYMFASPELDKLFTEPNASITEAAHYMTVSGSLRGQGGRLFLYSSTNWVDWTYRGLFFSMPFGHPNDAEDNSGFEWKGSFGANFEVANYFSLDDGSGEKHHFVAVGTEGGRPTHGEYWSLWASGDLKIKEDGSVVMEPTHTAVSDYGRMYAANSFWDTKHNRHIIYGWILEDNGFDSGHTQPQGWAGMLTLPRELFVVTIKNVVDIENRLETLGPFKIYPGEIQSGVATKIVKTLGVRPISEIESMRGMQIYKHDVERQSISTVATTDAFTEPLNVNSKSFEIVAVAKDIPKGACIGFVVRATEDKSEQTIIYYDDARGRIVIDRSKSSKTPNVNLLEESGKFELFQIAIENGSSTTTETLNLRIFVDSSVIEVYANDRFALSARIYPSANDAIQMHTYTIGKSVGFSEIAVYSDPLNVFHDRDEEVTAPNLRKDVIGGLVGTAGLL